MSEFALGQADMVNVRGAAKLLGVSIQTVKNYIYSGKLRSYRTPGGHHRISHEDLMSLRVVNGRPSKEEMLEMYNDLYHGYMSTLRSLTNALDKRDGIGSGHSGMVANYVALLTRVMGISREEQESIKLAAQLHDIGKVFVSERILSKPGKLTDQEYHLIRQHPEMGERILNGVSFLQGIKPLIRHHHERFDGQGYPDRLSSEDIPLGARIISVAEAFDCIIRESTFQRAWSLKEATDEITRHAGTQFDPEIVRIFTDEVVSKLRDADGEQYGGIYAFYEGKETEGL